MTSGPYRNFGWSHQNLGKVSIVSKQTEVVHAGIDRAESQLTSSHNHSNTGRTHVTNVRGRQNAGKWAPMPETAGVTQRSSMVAENFEKKLAWILKSIEEFRQNVQITRDEFENTDEAGRAKFNERISSVGGDHLDRYGNNKYDQLNEVRRMFNLDDNPLLELVAPELGRPDVVPPTELPANEVPANQSGAPSMTVPSGTPSGAEPKVNPNGNKSADLG